MESHFGSDFFQGNRARLRELFTGTAPIVLTAYGPLQRQADAVYAFYQDPSFWYLTGIDDPGIVLVMDRDKDYLIVPGRDAVRVAFDGAIDTEGLKQRSGIDQVFDEHEGWKRLSARLKRAKHVATLAAPPTYIEHYSMYTNPTRKQLLRTVRQHNPEIELLDLSQHLARMRMIKQPIELAAMQQAIDLTNKGIKRLASNLARGRYSYEYEMEADLTRTFRSAGARGHAFDPVIAGGKNACTLHHFANNDALRPGTFVVVDVGAEYDHYAADVTRTLCVGEPTKRQRAVFEGVKKVHAYALSLLKPGVMIREYEQQVHTYMGEVLRELGLIKSIDREAVHEFFPHATSHYLGLTAHDAGLYDEPLQSGVAMVVEPGIYIPAEGIGVRIEDDLVITDKGNRVLSRNLPAEL